VIRIGMRIIFLTNKRVGEQPSTTSRHGSGRFCVKSKTSPRSISWNFDHTQPVMDWIARYYAMPELVEEAVEQCRRP
jgi:hypothetical protein